MILVPNAHGVASQTIVAIPPSDLDPDPGWMRRIINGVDRPIQYDPAIELP